MPGQAEIRGEKALLRPWRGTDVDFVLGVTADPLIPLVSQVPDTPDAGGAAAFIDAQTARFEEGRGWAWAVVPFGREEPAGYVGALWVARSAARASIGYWTGAAGRRGGVTTDAVKAASAWLFARADVVRLEAYIEPWNEGSVRVAERAGFEREGLMRSFAPIGGRRRDAYLYARIAPSGGQARQE
ncbi:GNAT family protein [Actinoplanes sp. NPDC051411]|uniref:GNAT family N-acetyltransferase n=1 Tax=Actinoplanes sp. NPDC051411 TaxID=3155522 RepID=UPI0034248084